MERVALTKLLQCPRHAPADPDGQTATHNLFEALFHAKWIESVFTMSLGFSNLGSLTTGYEDCSLLLLIKRIWYNID